MNTQAHWDLKSTVKTTIVSDSNNPFATLDICADGGITRTFVPVAYTEHFVEAIRRALWEMQRAADAIPAKKAEKEEA